MKATITIGISASGKTSWARTQDARVICRDDIRTKMLIDDGFDATNQNIWSRWKFAKEQEKVVTKRSWEIAGYCAGIGKDIIICDTNLNADRRAEMQERLETLGYTVEYKQFDISYEEACKRDRFRKDTVGEAVIYKQWLQLYGEPYKAPEGAKKCVIVDIDGTLAHMGGRRGPFEWDKVHGDSCDEVVQHLVNSFDNSYELIVMSGRDGCCYDITKQWLDDNTIYYDQLVMRAAGDMRKDYIVKRELFDKHVRGKFEVVCVIDDRPQLLRLWLSLGLKTISVGDPYIEF